MERQVHSWFIQYVASSTNVGQREATRLADQIFSWRDSYGSSYKDVLCNHTPRILLPVAHALVDNWKKGGCLSYRFCGYSASLRRFQFRPAFNAPEVWSCRTIQITIG